MRYAKVIHPGKCLQYTGTTVEGTPANREEWEKYDFYPTYDIVGEVLMVNGVIVLKVDDGIYVPMDGGLEEVNEEYYHEHKGNWRELRESTLHSISHIEDYIRDKFKSRRPELGIIRSRANYYISIFKKHRMEHADHYVDAYQKYSAGLIQIHLLGLDSLPEDARTIAGYAMDVIRSEQEDLENYTIVSWVVGVCTDAYLSIIGSQSQGNQDKVFREVFIEYSKSLYV